MEQRTRTILIYKIIGEITNHQQKNQELRAGNTFVNKEYKTKTKLNE